MYHETVPVSGALSSPKLIGVVYELPLKPINELGQKGREVPEPVGKISFVSSSPLCHDIEPFYFRSPCGTG